MYKATKEVIEDILTFRRSVKSYADLAGDEKRKVIAAFLSDPDSDHDNILIDEKKHGLMSVISLFFADENARGITLQDTWQKVIEDHYKALLSDLVEDVSSGLQGNKVGYLSERAEWLQSDKKQRWNDYQADQRSLINV